MSEQTQDHIKHALAVVWEEGFDFAQEARMYGYEGPALRSMNPYRDAEQGSGK